MAQYGFFFDQSRCTDCRHCSIACRDWNGIDEGPVKWLRMFQTEKGSYPNVKVNVVWAPCYHCENPICVDACPNKARYKEDKYGAVLVDTDRCKGARNCWLACPYGAPQYASDAPGTKTSQCTMCIDRLEQGLNPRCAEVCLQRALDFGPLGDLGKKYGNVKQLEDMPSPNEVKPAVVFKPQRAPTVIIPYDVNRALDLLAKRDAVTPGLAPVFTNKADVTDVPEGLVGRGKLNMKPGSTSEAMYLTKNDEA